MAQNLLKLHDIESKHFEGENRLMDISEKIEAENTKMKSELENIRISLSKLLATAASWENRDNLPT